MPSIEQLHCHGQRIMTHHAATVVELKQHFYRAMLRIVRLCHSMLSVRLSVCLSVRDVQIGYRDHLGWKYFENNNFTTDSLS